MRSTVLGRLLLAAGGLLIVLGSFWPEVVVLAHNRLHPDDVRPDPDRSHWVVFREDLDMLADPDPDLDAWNYDFYRAEGAGLAYLAALGAVVALSSVVAQSRGAALLFYAFHAVSYGGLAYLSFQVWHGAADGGKTGGFKRGVLLAFIALVAFLGAETMLLLRGLRRGPRSPCHPVDAVNLFPTVVLLAIGAVLFAILRGHPNWPAGGYLVIALGALAAVLGMVTRRPGPIQAPATAPAPPGRESRS